MLNLKPTTTIPVMQDLDNRDIRRELYMANSSKCVGGEFDNTAIIVEIVNTRLALANLFGKKTYAEKSLYKTMAETPENVYKLLDQLRDAYMPAALAEVQELEEYAQLNLDVYAKSSKTMKLEALGYPVYAGDSFTLMLDKLGLCMDLYIKEATHTYGEVHTMSLTVATNRNMPDTLGKLEVKA